MVRHLVALMALLFLLGGCVTQPAVQLHSVRVQSVGPMGVGLAMVMKVNNKNFFDVQVRNVRANVVVAEKVRLPMIAYNPDIWLGAKQTTLVPVPVTLPWASVGPLLSATIESDTIDYRVQGVADVTAVRMLGIRRNDEPFDDEAEVSRAQLVAAANQGGLSPPMRR
ncbi:MAG: LEA type 2 family protein [Myxococcales bacterium]|nr:LEA type 2 family protein [Myxococcales bacterium]